MWSGTAAGSGQPWLFLGEPWKPWSMETLLSPWGNSSMNPLSCCGIFPWKQFSMGLVQTPLNKICVHCPPCYIFCPYWEKIESVIFVAWLPFKNNRLLIDYCLALPCSTELTQLTQLLLTAHWWLLCDAPVFEGPSSVCEHSLQTAGSELGYRYALVYALAITLFTADLRKDSI